MHQDSFQYFNLTTRTRKEQFCWRI